MVTGLSEIPSKRVRSPGFPFIGLKKALARAKEFYDHEKRNWANVKVAVKHWGFNETSSGGKQTLAALAAYGLLQDNGSADSRQVRLSDIAIKVILDTRNPSPDRVELLKTLALKPKLHKEIWDKYEGQLPSQENLRHFLVVEHDPPFNENWVDHFIGEFLASLEFAGLNKSDTLSLGQEDKAQLDALIEEELGVPEVQQQPPPAGQFVPKVDAKVLPGVRQDLFSLSEGTVSIQWPASLSAESFEDLSAWLDILKRKIGRSVKGE
jgi:hypothetical protein